METHTHRTRRLWSAHVALALIALTFSAAAGRPANAAGEAEDPADSAQTVRHVRTIGSRLNALMATGVRRSPMFRMLLDRLNRSTVIVYVEDRLLPGQLSGRLTLIGGG